MSMGSKTKLAQNIHAGRGWCECMQTNFGGCGFSGFEDLGSFLFAFKTAINFPSDHYGGQKIAQKFMQVEVDVKCMQTNFDGCGFSGFRDFAPFHLPSNLAKISLRTMDCQKNQLKIKIGLAQ